MIRTLLVLDDDTLKFDVPIDKRHLDEAMWYWVDFSEPTTNETQYLSDLFGFHHLAVEDCLHGLQRPKVDDYGEYRFFVLHTLSNSGIMPEEINLFEGSNYILTYHNNANFVIDEIWEQLKQDPARIKKGPDYLLYSVLDGLVDQYFPLFCKFGDELEWLESEYFPRLTRRMINRVFKIRRELLILRRSLEPLRDVIKSILHPEDKKWKTRYRAFFSDIHDNLIRLVEMTETYRHMGLDLIESHVSLNSHRINHVMVTLTVITTIFMPLTFIAGIYGMNFDYMPELRWKYGYFSVLAFMAVVAGAMVLWFRRKEWF